MTKSKILLALPLVFALLGPFHQVKGEEGWCFAAYKESPKSVFGFIASFSLELTARKNQDQISQSEYDRAMQTLQDANAAFARLESALGCQKIEAVDNEFHLRPNPDGTS